VSEVGSFVPARRESVAEAEIDGEVVLLDTSSGALHVLNSVAAVVWSELDGARDLDTIVTELSGALRADADEVRRDVTTFIDQLGSSGLLSRLPPTASPGSR
jgi:hypothetical protein